MTHAGFYIFQHKKGVWRTARAAHACSAYFSKPCAGNGNIAVGERYFDTEEIKESFTTYRVCQACSIQEAPEARAA